VPAIPELTQPLSDGRVTLRLGAERDIPEVLIAHQDDPDLHVRLGMDGPPTGAQLGRTMEEAPARRSAGERVTLTILEPGSDVWRGWLVVHSIDWEHLRAELGIELAPQARGRGLARAALRLAARWVFDVWGFERVEMLTLPDNAPMLRAAEGAGFVTEGLLRSRSVERGRRVDDIMLSLLAGDPRGSR
jgi:RimJ/RimL family protein N-acetyltransferase